MYISKLTIIGSDNGLSPGQHQAIVWTNAETLLTGPVGTSFYEILIKIHTFSFKKIHLKMLFGKWHPFCLGLNLLSKIHAFSFNKMHLKMLSAKWQQFCLASLWYIVGIYPIKYVHSFVVLCFVMMRLSVLIGYISVVYPSSSGSWFNMKMSSYQ